MALQEQVKVADRWNGKAFSTRAHDIENTSHDFWGDRQRKLYSATSVEDRKQSRRPASSTLTNGFVAFEDDCEPSANESLCEEEGNTSQDGRRSADVALRLEPVAQEKLRSTFTQLADLWNGRLIILGFMGLVVTDWLTRTGAISLIISSRG